MKTTKNISEAKHELAMLQKKMDKLTKDLYKGYKLMKDFLQHLYQIGSETTTEVELQSLYNKTIDISLDGHKVKLPFDAVNYNNLVHLVEQAIREF